MRADYKRDMNHNYLILEEEKEVNTASYQVRILVGNIVPSLLKCHLQGMDGRVLFFYDITSRQSVSALFEKRKLGVEELRILFGSFVRAVEEMAEYLLNPGHLVLDPAYIFLDAKRQEVKFCYLPGYDRGIREQFQTLTEYILPLLDHQDGKAVILGYGIYRRAMEDQFHLECVKEELYGTGNPVFAEVPLREENTEKEREGADGQQDIKGLWEEKECPGKAERDCDGDSGYIRERGAMLFGEDNREADKHPGNSNMGKLLLGCAGFALVMLGIMAACVLGYLPWIEIEWLLGGTVTAMAAGCLLCFLWNQKRKKSVKGEEEPWREKARRNLEQQKREDSESLKPYEEEQNMKKQSVCREEEGRLPAGRWDSPGKSAEGEELKDRKSFISEQEEFGETVVLFERKEKGPATLVSREPGELATIYLEQELTVIGKLAVAADAVLPLPTVSRVHARIRRRDGEYYLTDLNSRNGTSVNGVMLKGDEEYRLQEEDQVDFAQARYVFLK